MAVYRIFPESDSFIFSEVPTANAGIDEILELAGYEDYTGTARASRALIKFNNDQITDVIDNIITGAYQSYLNFYLAEASELPTNYTIFTYPVSGTYDNGVGKFGDTPTDTSGVSWVYRLAKTTLPWKTSSYNPGTTGSYISGQTGGGNWYLTSGSVNLESSQSFALNSNNDLSINVTNATNLFYSGSIPNNGFIVKLQDSLEFNISSSIRLKFFSGDTNTIYPPFLEFKWDDSSYVTGSLSVVNSSNVTINVKNNKGRYVDEGKQRFRLSARPTYPTRAFTTSSIYLTNYALPSDSYWGLRDENSEEMIVDFDTNYTKISCDSSGPYFDVYMNGLQPERYYRLLIKSTIDGSTTVIDNRNVFKITRNG